MMNILLKKYIREIIRENLEIIDEDYHSIKEIRLLANEVLVAFAKKNVQEAMDFVKLYPDQEDAQIHFLSVNLYDDVYKPNKEKFKKLRNFLEVSSKTITIYLMPKRSWTSTKKLGDYSYINDLRYNPYLNREINLYYEDAFVEDLKNEIKQKIKKGQNITYQDVYLKLYYPFISTSIHELQHAYDDFRSNSNIYKSKPFEEFIKLDKQLQSSESEDKEKFLEKDKKYLNLPHEIWARFSQTMDRVRFTTSELVKNEQGKHYFASEMKDLKKVITDFKWQFNGFFILSDDMKKRLIRKVAQFWHIEQEKVRKEQKNPEYLDESALKEYTTSDGINLLKHLKQTDEEKKQSLPYDFSYMFDDFLEDSGIEYNYEGEPYEGIDRLESNNKEMFDLFSEWLYNKIQNNDLKIPHSEYPSWTFYAHPEVIKNQWLVHFTSQENAYDIYKNGFTVGVDDVNKLGLTTYLHISEKMNGGYNFAYTIEDFKRYAKNRHGYKYGDTVVLFKASGIRAWHYGDEEYQTIFYGETATNINIIEESYGNKWDVTSSKTGRKIVTSDRLENVVDWVVRNETQYRKHLYGIRKAIRESVTQEINNEEEDMLKHLKIEKFEDLIGRTVYNIKPVYGEHKVLKWLPDRGEYLLFIDGNRVLASPFQIIPISEKTEKETDSELKWVIAKLSSNNKVKNIEIEDYHVTENAELIITFDITVEDFSQIIDTKEDEKVIILYSGVMLQLFIDQKRGLKSRLLKDGYETIIQGNVYGKWSEHSPFIAPNYRTTETDWKYMQKIVERIILENI